MFSLKIINFDKKEYIKMNSDIFFVESPLQFLSALKASVNVSNANNKKVLIYINHRTNQNFENNLLQLENLIDEYKDDWDSIFFIEPKSKILQGKFYFFYFSYVIKNIMNTICENKVENIFIGDYRNYLFLNSAYIFKTENLFILDDGLATPGILKNYTFKEKHLFKQLTLKKRILLALFWLAGLRIKKLNVTFFSFLDLSKKQLLEKGVSHISYDSLFPSNKKQSQQIELNSGFILGSKLIEIGFLSKSCYIKYLEKAIKKYGAINFKYIPHRAELASNYNEIVNALGIELLVPTKPIELYLLDEGRCPEHIVSFYSTALSTLPSIFPDIKYSSIVLNSNDISADDKIKEAISAAYDQFKADVELIY